MADEKKGINWDLKDYFPEFNCPEMVEFKKSIVDEIKELQSQGSALDELSESTADDWENLILKYQKLDSRFEHIYSYVYFLSAADAKNEDYIKESGSLASLLAEFEKFDVELIRAFKNSSDELFDKFISKVSLKDIGYQLIRTRENAQKTMSSEQEMLAADMNVDGLHSWGRLYNVISSKLEFDMVMPDGETVKKPISEWRSLMADPNREIGRAAFEGGNKAWQGIEDACAAMLNAIAGTRLTLYKYRGIDHYLEKALFQAAITRDTLDAMYKAIHENIDFAREIFRIKAEYMGRKGIAWYEREAPLPFEDTGSYTWGQAVDMITSAYNKAYPELGEYFSNFVANKWVESEARGGKRPGAFCWSSSYKNLERVYMTFNGTLSDVTTLAHEVGHAFHGYLMHDIPPLARNYPMTLAETASTFGEQILAEGILSDDSIPDTQKLLMLDTNISDAGIYLLDITTRFEFEKAFHDERMNGEVSVSRLKELMVDAQKKVMGDVLEEGGEDPYFWASKLHFYKTSVAFYNYPYTFGYLFSKSIFNMFKQQGSDFLPKYEELLRLTGSGTVEDVTSNVLGVNVKDPSFWSETIRSLEEPLNRYKALLKA